MVPSYYARWQDHAYTYQAHAYTSLIALLTLNALPHDGVGM